VFPDPRSKDSDGDGLLDPVERDIKAFCAPAILAGADRKADTEAQGDDVQLIPKGTTGLGVGSIVVAAGENGALDTQAEEGDERKDTFNENNFAVKRLFCQNLAAEIPPATDPTSGDTDGDNAGDLKELTGLVVGNSIRDGGNGIAETFRAFDDVAKAEKDDVVVNGGVVILPGPNGEIESSPDPEGDDFVALGQEIVTDPLRPDTDDDLLSDGLELAEGANPRDRTDGGDFVDTDLDGLTDKEEETGWTVKARICEVKPVLTMAAAAVGNIGDGMVESVEVLENAQNGVYTATVTNDSGDFDFKGPGVEVGTSGTVGDDFEAPGIMRFKIQDVFTPLWRATELYTYTDKFGRG